MGKPLISDATMRGMYDTMLRLRAAKREIRGLSRADKAELQMQPEALAAAVLSQMHRRDTLVTEGAMPLFEAARFSWFPDADAGVHAALPLIACEGSAEESAALAAGIAMKPSVATHNRPVVVAVLRSFPALAGVLKLMEVQGFSLLVIVQGEAESKVDMNRRIASTKVPIMPVDDSDAVAVCRVMQESMLRARNGWGGAVIHAVRMPGAPDGVEGMRERLERRGLLLP
jgi:hypothetical protein